MDELSGLDRPRPLPAELRERLEAVFAEQAPAFAGLSGLDRPRPLPEETREKLLRLITARPSLRLVRIHPLSTALASAAAIAAVVIGIFFLGAEREAPLPGGPKPTASQGVVAIASPSPTQDSPNPGDLPTRGPSSSSSVPERRTASTFSSGGRGRGEACFPEEGCLAVEAHESTVADGGSPEPSPSPTREVRAPDPPRNVTATTGPGLGEITVGWEPPANAGSSPLRKYALYRTGPDGVEVTVAILEANVMSYVDRNRPFGSYSYRLRVRNLDAISGFSDRADATSLNAPS